MITGKTKHERLHNCEIQNFTKIGMFYKQFLDQKEELASPEEMKFEYLDIFHNN